MRFIYICGLAMTLSLGLGAEQLLNRKEVKHLKHLDTKSRFLGLGSGSSFNLNNAEYSLGALNSLIGLDSTSGTLSFENGSFITLGIIILIPLTIGLALLFYLIGGAGTGFTALRRTDLEMTARKAHE